MSRASIRRVWVVLAVAALCDALLAPFFPQFFERTFGADALLAPGMYIACCRIAVALSLPFWARGRQPLRLVAIGQGLATVTGAACALSPNLTVFLGLSFVTEMARSSYLLLYPVLVGAAPPEKRGRVVAAAVAMVGSTSVISALVGAALLERLGGQAALFVAAACDGVQLVLLLPIARKAPATVAEEEAAERNTAAPRSANTDVYNLAAVGFLSTFAFVLIRPHFTLFLERSRMPGAPLWALGAVFVVPSVMTVVGLPVARRFVGSGRGAAGLAVGLWCLALGSWLQHAAPSLALLVLVRALYGVAAYVVDVCLDHAALAAASDGIGRFGSVHAWQNVAIATAPLCAAALAPGQGMQVVFGGAALAAGAAAALATALWWKRPAVISRCSEVRS